VSDSADPNMKRIAPTLLGAIDRAVALCSRTLSFSNEGAPAPELKHFDLAGLVSDIATEISARENQSGMIENSVACDLHIFADRDQLSRVLSNLVLNAFQAGATQVVVMAQADAEMRSIEVADNGPAVSAVRASGSRLRAISCAVTAAMLNWREAARTARHSCSGCRWRRNESVCVSGGRCRLALPSQGHQRMRRNSALRRNPGAFIYLKDN
jgi:hypothetical protein